MLYGVAEVTISDQASAPINIWKDITGSVKDVLLQFPDEPYTTMRTFEGGILLMDRHLDRLIKGSSLESKDLIRQKLWTAISSVIKLLVNELQKDIRITTILIKNDDKLRLVVCIEDLQGPPSSGQIEIATAQRIEPERKSTAWVHDRQILESQKLPDTNEVVLMDKEGRLYEGLSSNFGLIKERTVIVAPDTDVLSGTIMKMVLDIAPDLGLTVARTHPTLQDLDDCECCFITSTSRLALPIHRIIIKERNAILVKKIPPMFELLRAKLQQRLRTETTLIV